MHTFQINIIMKRFLSLAFLISALSIFPSIGIEETTYVAHAAKPTTNRQATQTTSAKTSSGLSASSICTTRRDSQFGRLIVPKYYADIAKNLRNAGWNVSKRTVRRLDYTGTEYENVDIYTITKSTAAGSTVITLDDDEVRIKFPNSADKNAFMSSIKVFGYKMRGGRLMGGPTDCYWDGSYVESSGNTVKIVQIWEP